jgi:hypothetical protein
MDTRPDRSQNESSTPSDLSEAQKNLERALEAYDKEGEAGLRREMERIHPDPQTKKSRVVKKGFATFFEGDPIFPHL